VDREIISLFLLFRGCGEVFEGADFAITEGEDFMAVFSY